MSCPICNDLKRILDFRSGEYFKARSAAYYRVSTKLAARKNVDMERARSDWEEHQLICPRAAEEKLSIAAKGAAA